MMILKDLFFSSLWLLGTVCVLSVIYIIIKNVINGDD